ncbi:MAG TPA: hypothetical protein PL070_06770 [Flavobacteriales bacterium]|nr:hypothetical protein [Flavobacteriales bacterium]
MLEEVITRPEYLFTVNPKINDYNLLAPFLVFLFGLPSIAFLYNRKKRSEYRASNQNYFQRVQWISNLGLGLTLVYFSVDIFIMIQEKFPINKFPYGWERYLTGLFFFFIGNVIICQNIGKQLATTAPKANAVISSSTYSDKVDDENLSSLGNCREPH